MKRKRPAGSGGLSADDREVIESELSSLRWATRAQRDDFIQRVDKAVREYRQRLASEGSFSPTRRLRSRVARMQRARKTLIACISGPDTDVEFIDKLYISSERHERKLVLFLGDLMKWGDILQDVDNMLRGRAPRRTRQVWRLVFDLAGAYESAFHREPKTSPTGPFCRLASCAIGIISRNEDAEVHQRIVVPVLQKYRLVKETIGGALCEVEQDDQEWRDLQREGKAAFRSQVAPENEP